MAGRGQKGQTLVEFALLLGLLLFLVLGMVDLSRALFASSEVAFASREGARVGAVQPAGTPLDEAVIVEAVKSRLPALEQDKLNIDLSGCSETDVVVKVDYLFQPILTLIFKEPFRLKYSVTMRRE